MKKKINILFSLAVLGLMISVVPVHAAKMDLNNISVPAGQTPTKKVGNRTDSSAHLALYATKWSTPMQARITQQVHPIYNGDSWHNLTLNGTFNWTAAVFKEMGAPTLNIRTKSYTNKSQTFTGIWWY